MTEVTSKNRSQDTDGLLWSFLRDAMMRGTHISADTREKSYEEFSARLDAAAVQQVGRLKELLATFDHETEPQVRVCKYTQADDNLLYLTDCGKEFWKEIGCELYDFCHHCGGAVEEVSSGQNGKPQS